MLGVDKFGVMCDYFFLFKIYLYLLIFFFFFVLNLSCFLNVLASKWLVTFLFNF